jgi:hypothetical protein
MCAGQSCHMPVKWIPTESLMLAQLLPLAWGQHPDLYVTECQYFLALPYMQIPL